MVRIILSSEPDEYGFHYGNFTDDGMNYSVDVLPPAGEWRGGTVLEGYEPDQAQWIIYVNGEEIGRAEKVEAIAPAALSHLKPKIR